MAASGQMGRQVSSTQTCSFFVFTASTIYYCSYNDLRQLFWGTLTQICSATSRLLVHEDIADAFYARLKQRAETIKIADPLQADTRLGPVISSAQLEKIMGFIKVGHWHFNSSTFSI